MTQSVELLLDPVAEVAVRSEWLALHEAGLPSELRTRVDENHRPHITLFAGPDIDHETDLTLSGLVANIALTLQLGALMLFGPRRDRIVLVHQVIASGDLLDLQRGVGQACGVDSASYFAPGRWSPHVTLARRVPTRDVGPALAALSSQSAAGQPLRVTRCRRWDGVARASWLL